MWKHILVRTASPPHQTLKGWKAILLPTKMSSHEQT